jgi:hypothetical protein
MKPENIERGKINTPQSLATAEKNKITPQSHVVTAPLKGEPYLESLPF